MTCYYERVQNKLGHWKETVSEQLLEGGQVTLHCVVFPHPIENNYQ